MLLPLFAACALHLGTLPAEGWSVVEVLAPVAEPGVEEEVRGAVVAALAGRGAAGASPLQLAVERAEWRPGRRTGEAVIYDATLAVRFRTGARERAVVVSTAVPDPGDAAAAVGVRAATFADLARRAAAEGVTWLVLGGAAPAP